MVADLRAHYGMPRSCLIDGSVTPSELLSLIAWLPDDSAIQAQALGGPQWRGWTTESLMLRGIHLHTLAAVSKDNPKPIDLPDERQVSHRRLSSLSGIPGAVRRAEAS